MPTWRPLALLAGAGLLAMAGCEATPPPEARGRDVVRPALGFALDVPDGWTWRDLAGDVVLEVFRPAGGAAADAGAAPARHARTVVHVVVVDREGMTLDAWADATLAGSREVQADLEVVGREAVRLADGRPALDLVLKNPRGLEPMLQRLRLTMTDGRAYALMATAPESGMDAGRDALKECFDSFIVW